MKRSLFCLLLIGLAVGASAQSAAYKVWEKLGSGTYTSGFHSQWAWDYGHRYQTTFGDKTKFAKGKSPRPVLVNVWYPAVAGGTPMSLRGYYDVSSSDPRLYKFARELSEYAQGVAIEEVFWHERAKMTAAEKPLWAELLNSPTRARRGASQAKGKFPIVIVHSGYGSSYADQVVTCEYLASRGYIVVGSAFNRLDGTSFNIEGKEGASNDIEFLLARAAQMPGADWSRVGYIGHSGGAQAGLVYQSMDGCAVDAMVSLDTTEDYYSISDPRWNYMRDPIRARQGNVTRPIMFVADGTAGFEFADSLTGAPRSYFTVNGLDHNDYISDGVYARWAQARLAPEAKRREAWDTAMLVWDRYAEVCKVAGDFFDAELLGRRGALDSRYERDALLGFSSLRPFLDRAGVGVSGPSLVVNGKPTPRQIRPLLRARGAAAVAEMIRVCRRPDPVVYPVFSFALLFQLGEQGKGEDARVLFEAYKETGTDPGEYFLSIGRFMKQIGDKEFAKSCFRHLVTMDSENAEAKKELETMP